MHRAPASTMPDVRESVSESKVPSGRDQRAIARSDDQAFIVTAASSDAVAKPGVLSPLA